MPERVDVTAYLCGMLVKTTGLVLRSVKYGETSMIVDIYCRELGTQSYIVGGVRKPRSKFPASLFQVGNFLNLVVYHHEKPSLKRIKEAGSSLQYKHMLFDIRRSATAIFLVEVLRNALQHCEANRELFDYLEDKFGLLDTVEGSVTPLLFDILLGLSAFLGFFPGGDFDPDHPYFDLQEGVFTAQAPPHPAYLSGRPAEALGRLVSGKPPLGLGGDTGRQLLDGLLSYYQLHLDQFRELRSREILREVLRL